MSASMSVERARELLARRSAFDAARDSQRNCRCGQPLERGLRLGPGVRQTTQVLICWRCGWESPSLYGRTFFERNGSQGVRGDAPDRPHERKPLWR